MHQKQFYVGVDWASQSHHVCVLKADGDPARRTGLQAHWRGSCPHGGLDPQTCTV